MQKRRPTLFRHLHVRSKPGFSTQGQLVAGNRVIRCALGRSGIGTFKREGDGKTPVGSFRLLHILARFDNGALRNARLPLRPIESTQGWCDAVGDRNYNCEVQLPYPASYENMKRDDHLYDYCVVMDHNITKRLGVGGSAIFFHLAHDDYRPTEGCIAIARPDMEWLLPRIGTGTMMVVEG